MPLSVAIFVLVLVFLVIVVPFIVILHYVTNWKALRGLSAEEQRLLEELWSASQAMDSRLDALETILNDKTADARKES
jgi:phage shock protein B